VVEALGKLSIHRHVLAVVWGVWLSGAALEYEASRKTALMVWGVRFAAAQYEPPAASWGASGRLPSDTQSREQLLAG
jgi:hypothetical protein